MKRFVLLPMMFTLISNVSASMDPDPERAPCHNTTESTIREMETALDRMNPEKFSISEAEHNKFKTKLKKEFKTTNFLSTFFSHRKEALKTAIAETMISTPRNQRASKHASKHQDPRQAERRSYISDTYFNYLLNIISPETQAFHAGQTGIESTSPDGTDEELSEEISSSKGQASSADNTEDFEEDMIPRPLTPQIEEKKN